jgi:hypothetical protein
MMATVRHVTSSLGLRKFQAASFLLNRGYLLACWLVAQSSGLEAKTRTGYRTSSGNRSAGAQPVASRLCLTED